MTKAKDEKKKSREGPHRARALLRYHQSLVGDVYRNRAFARALRQVVRPGMTVMDLGSGSGLWAVFAARLGAGRVLAVEKEPLLVPLIDRLARENGVADRVTVVEGDSRRLDLPRNVDVLVSETVGSEGLDEHIVEILGDARRRFLRPGAVTVPRALTLKVAPAEDPRPGGVRPGLISDGILRELAFHVPNAVPGSWLRLSGPSSRLLHVPLGTLDPPPALDGLSAPFRVRDGRRLTCFALWSELDLAEGVRLSTRGAEAWSHVYFPVESPGPGPRQGRIEIELGGEHHRWRLVLHHRGRPDETRDYSPLLAWGALRSAHR